MTSAGENGRDEKVAANTEVSSSADVSFWLEVYRLIRRYKLLLLAVSFFFTFVVGLVAFQLTPRYTASAQVMIEAPQPQVVEMEEVVASLGTGRRAVLSEVQVLSSRELVGVIIDRLNLLEAPEFNASLRTHENALDKFLGSVEISKFLPSFLRQERDAMSQDEIRAAAADAFLERLRTSVVKDSRVIQVTFQSEDRSNAALVLNSLVQEYVDSQRERRLAATKRATNWITSRIDELRSNVESAEKEVERFREQAGLTRGKNTTINSQQITEFTSQLIRAKASKMEAEARLRQIETVLRTAESGESFGEVLSSPLIQDLRQQESLVLRQVATLSREFGPKHPRMINSKAELEDIRHKIAAEVKKILASLGNEVAIAEIREHNFEKSLKELEKRDAHLKTSEVQLRAMQREVDADRTLLKTVLARYREVLAQQELQHADARIIERASIPSEPSYPRKKLMIVAAFIGSFLIGGVLISIREGLDRSFRSTDQIERHLGLSTLVLVPSVSGKWTRDFAAANYVLENRGTPFAEAIRTLHTNLYLSAVEDSPKSFVITSALPREGKSTIAVSLARNAAQAGQKVILLDADLRRPSVHTALDFADGPGLFELLDGTQPIDSVICEDQLSGLHVIVAGSGNSDPPELFRSSRMAALIAELRRHYDLIIIDSPPVLVVSDALVLSRLVGRAVFVIRWGSTDRAAVGACIKNLRDAGADVAGAVLSMVNVKKYASYGNADSGYLQGVKYAYYSTR